MDGFPKCQVCREHFTLKGPAPYLLPCLHAVCETCVTSTAGGVISCSTCQREVNLTETHLQKDVVRQREIFHLTVQHRPLELLCTHEDDGNQAVCWCQECEELLCEYCQNLHEGFKATRKHAVQDVCDIQPGSLDLEEYCSIHKKYLLDTWDRSCDVLICARCRLSDHAQHDLDDISVAADAARSEIEAQQKNVLHVRDNYNSLLETTREQLKCATETSNTLRDNISHTFQSLKSMLDQREKELHISLQQHTDQTASHLDSKTKVAQSHYLRCQIASEYIEKALLYSTKCDLLKVKGTTEETTQTCLDSTIEKEDVSFPGFYTEGLNKLKSVLSSFGDIYAQKDVALQRHNIGDKASQTGEDLLVVVEDIQQKHEKEIQGLQSELTNAEASFKDLQASMTNLTRQKEEADNVIKEFQTRHEKAEMSVRELTCERDDMRKQEDGVVLLLRQQGIHFLKTGILNKSFMLSCTQLKFDRDRVNINKAHITTEGHLVNTAESKPHDHSKDRLVRYEGTTSTIPLPRCGTSQYWEVKGRVGIDKALTETNLLLLEIGLCVEEERDQHHSIDPRPQSYSLTVQHCTTHSSICRMVWKHGKYVLCLSDTLFNTPGRSTTLQYGVVFDDSRCRVVFIDLNTNKVMSVIDGVDCSRSLWPMFGVYNPDWVNVSMSLVVGTDIDMSEGKKAMILKALS